MSPALFLFELLKMGKLTRGPLVLYHLPKYWSRKPVIKNNFRILKKTHAYLQTILKAPVKFQNDRLKTVVGVTGTRYLLPIHFGSITTQKMSKLKMRKKVIKIYFRILKKKKHTYLQAILKAHVKFQKDRPKTVGGVKGTRYLLPIRFCSITTQKMSKLKMRKKW